MILGLVALSIILIALCAEACTDAFNDKGKKSLGHNIKIIEKVVLVMSPFMLMPLGLEPRHFLAYGLSYLLLRMSTFDLFYNVAKNNKLSYVGTVGWWDRTIASIPPWGRWIYRTVLGIAGLGIPFSFF